jgi:hypothetical protein
MHQHTIDANGKKMRTTLDLDDEVLDAVKRVATFQRKTAGQLVSELLREVLKTQTPPADGTGLPFMPIQPGAGSATLESVNALRDET